MGITCRLGIHNLGALLDLGDGTRVLSAAIVGEYLELEIDGATLTVVPGSALAQSLADSPPDEVEAEYEVYYDLDGRARRRFTRFKLPTGASRVPLAGDTTAQIDATTGEPLDDEPQAEFAVDSEGDSVAEQAEQAAIDAQPSPQQTVAKAVSAAKPPARRSR